MTAAALSCQQPSLHLAHEIDVFRSVVKQVPVDVIRPAQTRFL